MILHITTKNEWERAISQGEYTSPSLTSEGFIHCSTIKQTTDTANTFFKGQHGLILLCINENKLKSICKYEAPAGGGAHDPGVGSLFPHIYGPINISAVIKTFDFPTNDAGLFILPQSVNDIS